MSEQQIQSDFRPKMIFDENQNQFIYSNTAVNEMHELFAKAFDEDVDVSKNFYAELGESGENPSMIQAEVLRAAMDV